MSPISGSAPNWSRGREVDSTEDNMLKISTDGRKAALDMRLVTGEWPASAATKLDIVADNVARIWSEHHDTGYLTPGTDQPSVIPGGLQIVFCDLATPSEQWNAARGDPCAYRVLRR